MEDNYRKGLTFEQAEGVAPLPRQLSRKEISPGLRSQIKAFVHFSVGEASGLYGGKTGRLDDEWEGILLRHHIHRLHQTVPNFSTSIDYQRQMIDRELSGDYIKFYGLIQYILRDKQVPDGFAEAVKEILDEHMAGYRLLDSDTLVPLASDEEIVAIEKSIENISLHGNAGTRQHLKTASEQLSIGNWADSVRESIHAVESCARSIEPTAKTLADALKMLESSLSIHPSLKAGFLKIYGYTNDESGVRHALTEKDSANVDEIDAIFMFGACASFCSYLVGKSRIAEDYKA